MFNYTEKSEIGTETNMPKLITHIIIGGVLGIVSLIILFGSWTVIDQTERGVVLRLGEVVRVMEPGFNWKTPWFEDVVKMKVATQKIEAQASAASKDLQEVTTNIAVQYELDETAVGDIYGEYKKKGIRPIEIDPAIQDAIKGATAQFTAEELITKRVEVKQVTFGLLKERLAGVNVIVRNLDIINFQFNPKFNEAIEAKVTAEQDALKQVNITTQEEEKKKQQILKAEAIAEKTRLEVEALRMGSDLIEKIRAEADLVRAEAALKAAERWGGVLPTHMYGSAPLPLIDVSKQ